MRDSAEMIQPTADLRYPGEQLPAATPQIDPRVGTIFRNGFKVIWPVQPFFQKYSASLPTQISGIS